jgi:hypothetical protein
VVWLLLLVESGCACSKAVSVTILKAQVHWGMGAVARDRAAVTMVDEAAPSIVKVSGVRMAVAPIPLPVKKTEAAQPTRHPL